jgi:hypothetical protein
MGGDITTGAGWSPVPTGTPPRAMPMAAAMASATAASHRVTPNRIRGTAGARPAVPARLRSAAEVLMPRFRRDSQTPRFRRDSHPPHQGTHPPAHQVTHLPAPPGTQSSRQNPPIESDMLLQARATDATTQRHALTVGTPWPRRGPPLGWRWRRWLGPSERSSPHRPPAAPVLEVGHTRPRRGTGVLRTSPSSRSARSRQTRRPYCCASSNTSRGGCG